MATAIKHAKRSQYSNHNYKPFSGFVHRAAVVSSEKAKRKSFVDMIKSFAHKTTNK